MIKCAFISLALLLSNAISAQTGWELIRQNNFKAAQEQFVQVLEKDSVNREALEGMIFLSEFNGDELTEEKLVGTYIRNHYSDLNFYLFEDQSDRQLYGYENDKMSFRFQIPTISDDAYELKKNRAFEASQQKYLEVYNPFKWSFIGPFQNINGFGHVKEFSIEKEDYQPQKTYFNYRKLPLKWVEPAYNHPKHTPDFDRYLELEYKDAVCYANAFFETETDQEVVLAIGRYSPTKIWIDDQLLFDGKDAISFEFDTEQVKFKLPKGPHRMLVKMTLGKYYEGDITAKGNRNSYSLFKDFESGIQHIQTMKSSHFNRMTLRIRLTNPDGHPISLTSKFGANNYRKQTYETAFSLHNFSDQVQAKIKSNPENWFNYYALLNASLKYGNEKDIEEFFHQQYLKHPDKVFFKYLAAKVYMMNGKREKGYRALEGIDLEKCPSYALLSDQVKEVDPVNKSELFLQKLKALRTTAPSNYSLIKLQASYLGKNGKKEELKTFIEGIQKEYPEYKDSWTLNRFLDEDLKPYDYDMNADLDDDKALFKEAKKRLSKAYNYYDYSRLIKKYKSDGKESKALALYDEQIRISPYDKNKHIQKAKYLFNLERHSEAVEELKESLRLAPYNSQVHELLGDIYYDQDDKDTALKYYQQATLWSEGSFGMQSLESKIQKISGAQKWKDMFAPRTFEDWIKDDTWTRTSRDEESVVLGHSKDVVYDKNGKVHLYSKILVLILTEAGASSWVQYDFSRLGDIDFVKVIKANGAEVVPDAHGSFAVFKNLEPGDLIQLEASSEWRPESELGNELVLFNYLTYHAPVYNCKLEVAIPEGKKINTKVHRLEDNKVKTTKNGYDHYTWEYDYIPKVRGEEAIIDQTDIWANVQVSTIEDWGEVVNWYKAKTYRKLDSKYEVREILSEIIEPNMTDEQKVISVYNYVTEKIKYSFNNLLNSNYIPKNADLTCSSKIGDCKDVATVMINMLHELGIEAYYVLVKTNSYFDMEIVPSLYFDHVIAGVYFDGEMHYYDLTTDNYPHYVINENDVNAWGLIINDENEQLFRLPNDYLNANKNGIDYEITAQLKDDFSIDLEVTSQFKGLLSGSLRETLESKPKHEVENRVLGMIGEELFSNLKVIELDYSNADSITAPLKGTYTLQSENYADHVLDIYFMNIPFLNPVNGSVVFSSEDRRNTLDLNQITDIAPTREVVHLRFPSGKKLYKLPEDISIDNDYYTYQLHFKKEQGGVRIEKYQRFKKQQIPTTEFNTIKSLYNKLYDADKTKIVLVNKHGGITN